MAIGTPLELILGDNTLYPSKGKVVVVDRAVDLKTGTLSVVAEFPNPNAVIRPGQFGRVRAPIDTVENAILIPKRAVQEVQGMKTVLVVGADDVVALRTIKPGETVGSLVIVAEGVKPGERVIVEGVQKARPGSKVAPKTAPADGTGDAPAAAKTGARRRTRRQHPRRRRSPAGSRSWPTSSSGDRSSRSSSRS